jgi:hypothetical protein
MWRLHPLGYLIFFQYMLDDLTYLNEGDSMGFNKPWAVLPHGLLQVPAADRFCGSLHRLAPSVRRLKCS